ncbi:Histidine acid phosphatase family protein [Trichomonas vaginalis G3]|uniref:Histidine acid phosphatase family protein n=1 Tax=Trichomonas vaginalis (strain ATCC PRA-98 / G3) TaxID=412133 RepID=A2DLA5_TRIV3|nr:histidine acid phosphatase [Trichomonas vaginalis G3]EAY18723.1 Histidine acid phosphatase family protein [Trichomonas vaginalis G3]KAI5539331.1 acid phosphatase protein [Trichomonas vaginalis G3]|eukprot:XP_001579709.1 histidine acid phosphatase [Trichomonas vaginalis G3]
MTLIYASIMTRHGHRTPESALLNITQRGRWYCDEGIELYREDEEPSFLIHTGTYNPSNYSFLPNCQGGDLTTIGRRQLRNLGSLYREYYIDKLHLLSKYYNETEFYAKSSPVDRAFKSAYEFVNGFYPPEFTKQHIHVDAGLSRANPLNLDVQTCEDYKKVRTDFRNGPTYNEYLEKVWPILEPAAKIFNLTKTVPHLRYLCSWTTAFNCATDAPRPDFFTKEFVEACLGEQVISKFGVYNSSKYGSIGASPLFRMFFHDIETSIQSGRKLIYYSAHDATIASILTFLKKFSKFVPPYASHFVIELYRDENTSKNYLRFFINGENFKVEGFDDYLVPYDEFKERALPKLVYCKNIPV